MVMKNMCGWYDGIIKVGVDKKGENDKFVDGNGYTNIWWKEYLWNAYF